VLCKEYLTWWVVGVAKYWQAIQDRWCTSTALQMPVLNEINANADGDPAAKELKGFLTVGR
jgi:hypothetical protein